MGSFEERRNAFQKENNANWCQAIETSLGKTPPPSTSWSAPDDVISILKPFGHHNHAFLPKGGGLDILDTSTSREDECIELKMGDDAVIVLKPKILTFEYIPESPENSFFLLEIESIPSTGIYEDDPDAEQLVEVDDEYLNYSVWDHRIIGHNEDGTERYLPDDARIVTRERSGKILIVAKASLWNQDSSTYDGRHGRMTPADIRKIIENSL
ncbi:MAG: hypothetical protein ACODTL_20475 [Brucella sp.]